MPDNPSPSKVYREEDVDDIDDDDDDDDLDDLDDVLANFNAPRNATGAGPSAPTTQTKSPQNPPTSAAAIGDADDEDFEASLVEGMESLLKQLAGNHPPGPMADKQAPAPSSSSSSFASTSANGSKAVENDKRQGGTGGGVGGGDMTAEEEEQAWQKAIEMMLSGEGLEALGLDKDAMSQGGGADAGMSNAQAGPSRPQRTQEGVLPPGTTAGDVPPGRPVGDPTKPNQAQQDRSASGSGSFDETIRRTMEQLKSAGSNRGGGSRSQQGGGGDGGGDTDSLAALLAQLGSDPSGEGDDDLGGLLDGMMAQLMTKEVLEEPMVELASKYPDYLASPPGNVTSRDLEKYERQSQLVSQIVATFRKTGYSDEKDGKEISRLVSEMQDLGGPPKEIMGDLPEGFDLEALGGGGEEGCAIM